ncbi:unnamed protein product [Caenorhabditis bovis]|uniref:Transcription initiation factor TFIID subunit 12 n=1 Tax=Caenorhabditis bovis TaxID=2654633 RepID=A0A8S1EP68_9PELO|nr:unnamed protein product [Caenorhabditis bovis]
MIVASDILADIVRPCNGCGLNFDTRLHAPHILACSHTFCLMCLSKEEQRKKRHCFECKAKYNKFSPNTSLLDVIMRIDERRQWMETELRRCDECDSRVAVKSLRQCETCENEIRNRSEFRLECVVCLECCVNSHNGHSLFRIPLSSDTPPTHIRKSNSEGRKRQPSSSSSMSVRFRSSEQSNRLSARGIIKSIKSWSFKSSNTGFSIVLTPTKLTFDDEDLVPMHPQQAPGEHYQNQMGMMNAGGQQQPGGGGPMRVQQVQQVRAVPYSIAQAGGHQQQMRNIQQNQAQHYSPINMNQQNQFSGQQPIHISSRPQMPPNPQQQVQQQQPPPPQMAGPSMQMGHMQPQPMGMNQGPPPQHMMPQPHQFPPHPMQQQPQQTTTMQISATSAGCILEKARLDELMLQINKNTVLEESVKDCLVEYADDFVTSVIDKACKLIKQRGSRKIEARDIEFILKNVYNTPTVPRAMVHTFGAPETIEIDKERNVATDAHKQRMAMLKKQLRKI